MSDGKQQSFDNISLLTSPLPSIEKINSHFCTNPLWQHMPGGLLLVHNGSVIRANEVIADWLDSPLSEIEGKGLWELVPQEYLSTLLDTHSEPRTFKLEFFHPQQFLALVTVTPVSYEGFSWQILWIHEREELKQAWQQAEVSKSRYHQLLHLQQDGVWEWKIGQNHLQMSETMIDYFGFGSRETPFQWEDVEKLVHPNDVTSWSQMIEKLHHQQDIELHLRMWSTANRYEWFSFRGSYSPSTNSSLGLCSHWSPSTQTDPVTGLASHQLLLQMVERFQATAKRRKLYTFALIVLGFQEYSTIVSSKDSRVRDELLFQVAIILQELLRPGDIVSRREGDEFTILLDDLTHQDDLKIVIEKINEKLSFPLHIKEHVFYLTPIYGISIPQQHHQPIELFRQAHFALEQVRKDKKTKIEFYRTSQDVRIQKKLQIDAELRTALERNEFRLAYQPIVDLNSGEIVGFEALIRWQNEKLGFVSPMEFIPVAEETELILPIGSWVLQEACRTLASWSKAFPHKDLHMSINLSGKQLETFGLADEVQQEIQAHGIPKGKIHLEITESMLIEQTKAVEMAMLQFLAMEVPLYMDDFGTGYSSLSYLHRFPLQYLKIDRSFVRDMHEKESQLNIVRSIIHLGKSLGMKLVAEGVETKEHLDSLRSMGCSFAQGYFFAKPLPAQDIVKMLKESPTW